MKRLLFLVVLLPLLLGGCSVSPGDKVDVVMKEYSIAVSPQAVTSGRIRWAIDSVGKEDHDLAFILAKSVEDLPRTPEGKIDLVANRPIDEIEKFAPGHYIATSPLLRPGHYLVICTIHVDQGMVAKLTINPRTKENGK
jgi:plastocyanin